MQVFCPFCTMKSQKTACFTPEQYAERQQGTVESAGYIFQSVKGNKTTGLREKLQVGRSAKGKKQTIDAQEHRKDI